MKKLIIALGLMAITFGNTAMAHDKEIDKHVQQAFNKEFAGAVDVQWYTNDTYVQVDFTFNSMRLVAYYDNDGKVLAVVRNIYFPSLPLSLQLDLKKIDKGYWITKICEVTNQEGTQYRVTLESAEKIIQLSSNGVSGWEVIKREVK
ncbi:MAG: hypothetical protein E6H10_17790 [Bacteroidetes bacterium]|nr:MAG: hypothetical protein E6H10_17790 [Bacteroidota bacterium]